MQAPVRPPLPPCVRPPAARERSRPRLARGAAPAPLAAQRHHRALLASLPPESALTHAVIAGLTTLRLVDRWHFRGAGEADDVVPVRMALAQVDAASPLEPPLAATVERVAPLLARRDPPGDAQATAARTDVAASIGAYALELEIAGLPGAARDAYRLMRALGESVSSYGGARGERLAGEAAFGWARAALADGALEDAERIYRALRDEAALAGQPAREAEATLGLAAVHEAADRLDDAEHLVNDALSRLGFTAARCAAGDPLVAIAMRARARTRRARGDWPGSARALATAFHFTRPGHEQDLLLAELGGTLVRVGAMDAAQHVLECLATTAVSAGVRDDVDQALLGVYAQRRSVPAFERCRRRLLARTQRPAARGEALLAVVTGYEMMRASRPCPANRPGAAADDAEWVAIARAVVSRRARGVGRPHA